VAPALHPGTGDRSPGLVAKGACGASWVHVGDFADGRRSRPPRGASAPLLADTAWPSDGPARSTRRPRSIQFWHSMTLASLAGTALGLLPATRALDRSFPLSRSRFSRFCQSACRTTGTLALFVAVRVGIRLCPTRLACSSIVPNVSAHAPRAMSGIRIVRLTGSGARMPPAHADSSTLRTLLRRPGRYPTVWGLDRPPTHRRPAPSSEQVIVFAAAATFASRHDHPRQCRGLADIRAVAGRNFGPGHCGRLLESCPRPRRRSLRRSAHPGIPPAVITNRPAKRPLPGTRMTAAQDSTCRTWPSSCRRCSAACPLQAVAHHEQP